MNESNNNIGSERPKPPKKPLLPPRNKPKDPNENSKEVVRRYKSDFGVLKPILKPPRRNVQSMILDENSTDFINTSEYSRHNGYSHNGLSKQNSNVSYDDSVINCKENRTSNLGNKKDHNVFNLKRQLKDLKSNIKPCKSNLNKLKSCSTPSIFYDIEEEKTEDSDKDAIDGKFHIKKKKGKYKGASSEAQLVNLYRRRACTEPLMTNSIIDKFSDLHHDEDSQLFDHVIVVTLKKGADGTLVPYISFRFPPKIEDYPGQDQDERMNSIPQFCFPDPSVAANGSSGFKKSETFSFVLTDISGKRFFGYCKLIQVARSEYPEVYCIISPFGLFAMYSQILDEVEKQRAYSSAAVFSFLKAVLSHSLPKPTDSIIVSFYTKGNPMMEKVTLERPGDSAIHEHVDLKELFSTLSIPMILHLLGCLLNEAKVILCASSLRVTYYIVWLFHEQKSAFRWKHNLLSSCCHGLISLLYPFQWEHTYIPVLPNSLIDVVCLPTPFLLGIMENVRESLDDMPMEQVTIVNLNDQSFIRKEHDKNAIPSYIANEVKSTLEELLNISCTNFSDIEFKARNQVITEVFVHAYIQLIGHFEEHYQLKEDSTDMQIEYRSFYKGSYSKEQKKFLKQFAKTQAFQTFTRNRKKNGPSKGLFERRFADWKKKKNANDYLKSNFKGFLDAFKKKVKNK